MRMAELSTGSGVPIATIKYYRREGLLGPGEPTGHPNQVRYGPAHVRRLALIRSLLEVGGLSVAAVKAVLADVDDPAKPLHDVLGSTLEAVGLGAGAGADDGFRADAAARVEAVLAERGWAVSSGAAARTVATDVLAAMLRLTDGRLAGVLPAYAAAVEAIAEADLSTLAEPADRETRVETALIGTVLGDHLLAALRRLAQEHVSARRFPRSQESS
jgi:DNA-binding transcriptional MerR regulator